MARSVRSEDVMQKVRFGAILLPFVCALVGCGSDGDSSDDGERGGTGGEAGASADAGRAGEGGDDASGDDQLVFGDCPASLPGITEERTCAKAQVPLLYDEPAGEQIELLVARYPAVGTSHGQLWLLDGGPGGTGANYMREEMMSLYSQLGLEIFIPQHRGTGHSTPLGCEDAESAEECSQALVEEWGDGLRGFSSAAAGEDLGQLIARAQTDDGPVYVLGISYGSYWGQRYLQRYPSQATGIMLDGILPMTANLLDGDGIANEAGLRLLADCGENPTCLEALDDDPVAAAESVMVAAEADRTRCLGENGFNRDDLSTVLTMMMVLDVPQFVPATILRLSRCNEQDRDELEVLFTTVEDVLNTMNETDLEYDNPFLGAHVLRSDILAELSEIPLAELVAARDQMLFRSGAFSLEGVDQVLSEWGVNYAPVDKTLSKPTTPVLLMNGGYDMQTPLPWIDELAETLGASAIVFPTAGHAVDYSLAASAGTADPCSLQIKRQFVADPAGTLDRSCEDDVPPIDFGGQQDTTRLYSDFLFGNPELLPGFTPPSSSSRVMGSVRPSVPEIAEILRTRAARLPSLAGRMRGFRHR